ncbi:MAG TPA: hypothetical protein VGR25_02810 [bacterium]|nr:hypothetical protein [bacterium]
MSWRRSAQTALAIAALAMLLGLTAPSGQAQTDLVNAARREGKVVVYGSMEL